MESLNYVKLMNAKPTLLHTITNQKGQTVYLYEHPTQGDLYPVIAVIEDKAVTTEFFDTDDFYENSDYNPVLIDGEIVCAYEL